MRTPAVLSLGLAVLAVSPLASAQDPVERIVYDGCTIVGYSTDYPRLVCQIVVDAPDFSRAAAVADGLEPSVSPDGSTIAFDGGPQFDDIVVLDLARGTLTNLTNDPAADSTPTWSPDGTRIAFASDRTGAHELFVMNADGSGLLQLTQGVGFVGQPAWSPDGARIAFDCTVAAGNADLCAVAADGTGLVRLTDDPAWDGGAAWSPDGTRIAFSTSRYSAYGSVLAIMNADGTSVAKVGDGVTGYSVAWSLDGARLAVAQSPGACEADGSLCYDTLRVYTTDGADLGLLTGGSHPTFARMTLIPRPMARFDYACSALACTFDATPSWDLGATITSFAWDFGDGTVADGLSAAHTFAAEGPQTVTLTATDDTGVSGSHSQSVVVAQNVPPVASIVASCSGLYCHVDSYASSDADGYLVAWSWDFGDGTTSDSWSAGHTFRAPGSYTVTLTVTDNLGATGTQSQVLTAVNVPPTASFTSSCSARTCSFNGSASSDPDGLIASYAWTFGDGTTAAYSNATHTYSAPGTYTVTLTVTDNLGGTGTRSQTVTAVNTPPVASFTASCSALACSLNASASSDSDGSIASYAWTFGDGSTATGVSTAHTYATAGSFTVTLTVTDNLGGTGTRSQTVTAVNTPPVASFTSSCSGLACSFTASASSDSDGTIVSYAWTFGDGTSGGGVSPTHTYTTAGSYTVTLTVTDNGGATGTRTATAAPSQTHVGDLDGSASSQFGTWTAVVTVTVHSSVHALVAGATVTGSWTGGGSASCTTGGIGQCSVSRSGISGTTHSVTFTVNAVTHPTMTYKAAANHESDGDSNGTSIVVVKR